MLKRDLIQRWRCVAGLLVRVTYLLLYNLLSGNGVRHRLT